MEIVCNYGYVVLFSSAYPLLPFLALLLNLAEIKIDAWRLSYQCQRPIPEVANSIGIWIDILRFLSIIGAFTNTGILIFTTDIFDSKSTAWQWITFLSVEHGIVIFKYVLALFVYTTPDSVAKAIIWSNRIVNEKIYGKATDVDEQMKLRNLYLKDLPDYTPISLSPETECPVNY
jgi:hypothetical protein